MKPPLANEREQPPAARGASQAKEAGAESTIVRLSDAAKARLRAGARAKGMELGAAVEQAIAEWTKFLDGDGAAETLDGIGEPTRSELVTGGSTDKKLAEAKETHPLRQWARSETQARARGMLPRIK